MGSFWWRYQPIEAWGLNLCDSRWSGLETNRWPDVCRGLRCSVHHTILRCGKREFLRKHNPGSVIGPQTLPTAASTSLKACIQIGRLNRNQPSCLHTCQQIYTRKWMEFFWVFSHLFYSWATKLLWRPPTVQWSILNVSFHPTNHSKLHLIARFDQKGFLHLYKCHM